MRNRTHTTFGFTPPEDMEGAAQARPHFFLRNAANIQTAYFILKTLGVRFMEDEEGQRVKFSFYNEMDYKRAFRSVRLNIDREKEGRVWK